MRAVPMPALVRRAYGEIGEIADISKIAERARDAD